jgi:hypothetical protein
MSEPTENLSTVSVSNALRLDMALTKARLASKIGKAIEWNEWIALLYSTYLKSTGVTDKQIKANHSWLFEFGLPDRKNEGKKEGDQNVLATKQRTR